MNFFKKIIPFMIITAALAGCSDDSSTSASPNAGPDEITPTTGSSSSNKSTGISSSSIAKDKETSSSSNQKISSNSGELDDIDYEYGYVGFINDHTSDLITREEVRIWAPIAEGLKIVSTDTLDNEGKLKLNTSLSGYHLIEMQHGDLAAMRWVNFNENMKTGIYLAKPTVMVTGFIKDKGVGIKNAKIKILNIESQTKSDGEFTIEGLPDGVHFMTVEYGGESRIYQVQTTVLVGYKEEQIINRINWDYGVYTLLTDYEDWSSGRIVPGNTFDLVGPTYFYTDSLYGGGSRFIGKTQFAHGEKFRKDDTTGYYMYLKADIDENTENPFAIAGFRLGENLDEPKGGYPIFDISEATGLSFDAKGTGSVGLQFIILNENGKQTKISTEAIELKDTWGTYNLPFDEIRSKLTTTYAIDFVLTADAEVYIDNVRLDGIVPTKWPSLGRKP